MSNAMKQNGPKHILDFLRISILYRWSFVCLTGLLLGFSYSPFPFPWLAWVALIPLISIWRSRQSPRSVFIYAYCSFLIAYAVAFSWPLTHRFAQTAWLSLPGLLVVPMYMSLPFFLSSFFKIRMGIRAGLFALIAFYLTMEYGLTLGPLAFPWTLLGYSQAGHIPFNQVAEITGVPGLSLIILLVNVFAYYVIDSSSSRPRAFFLCMFLGTLVCVFGYGHFLQNRLRLPTSYLDIGIVQPAIDADVWANVRDTARVDRLLALSNPLVSETPDLIIWPETSLPVLSNTPESGRIQHTLQQWVNKHNIHLLTGAILLSFDDQHRPYYRNAAVLYSPELDTSMYIKNRLLPFAERVPFIDRWPWLDALAIPAGGVRGYRPGLDQNTLRLDSIRFGVLICFENVFGNYTRRYIDKGADFIVTITQDGWWKDSRGYRQHFDFSRLRAIETRRGVLQVAVTGTSGLIRSDGTTFTQTRWMDQTVRVIRMPLYDGRTFYSLYGDWISRLSFFVSLFFVAWMFVSLGRQMAAKSRLR